MDATRRRRQQNQVTKSESFVAKTFKMLSDETVLPDDYPVLGMYVYIVDNTFARCNWIESTVGEWKRREGHKEIRRCNLFQHEGARLGDRVE